MIQANELRIGNYLMTTDRSFISVKTLNHDDDDILVNEKNGMFTLGYTAIPIPLTEYRLQMFGFDKGNFECWTNGVIDLNYVTTDDNIQYEYNAIASKTGLVDIKYLHQLQNLYFALTGKELEVNL